MIVRLSLPALLTPFPECLLCSPEQAHTRTEFSYSDLHMETIWLVLSVPESLGEILLFVF